MSSTASRRLYPRQLRRLQVRFWRAGEERPRQGFTKNVSLTGAFVATPDPAGRGDRLRLELTDGARSATLYAVVVHAHRVPPELRRFADSAMGLRFLGLDEVVGPFLGEEALRPRLEGEVGGGRIVGGTGAVPVEERGEPAEERFEPSGGRGDAAPAPGAAGGAAGDRGSFAGRSSAQPTASAGGDRSVPLPASPPPASGTGQFAWSPSSPSPGSGTGRFAAVPPAPAAAYALAFATAEDFLVTYRRDLANGGLFVTTDRPARLNERVAVELRLPGESPATVRLEGRVVQVVDLRPVASG
ncbi:MAG TPA: PilZ domain-containing protein, partial [Thermoanaerobaculia bacterium]|nr:PilZ domain-containing protein [Thermoanaerobaculia bacterium]